LRLARGITEMTAARLALPEPLGLVATMGCLHEGHLSLVARARKECAATAATLFVNPAQFGPGEDYSKYPRTLERDLELLGRAGVDLACAPSVEEIYPKGFQSFVTVEAAAAPLEGAARPGHFRGVATVCAKFFHLLRPQRAYFGQKDAQQLAIIRRMVRDLCFPLEIKACPTVREPDGLAMSSRNGYLSPAEREAAVILYQALGAAKTAWGRGECDGDALRAVMTKTLAMEPMARPQYASVADPQTLEELSIAGQDALFSVAVFVGSTRLIDNFLLAKGQWDTGTLTQAAKAS